jgi:hypothetical protein
VKLVQLGDADAAACVDGVCEVPGAQLDDAVDSEQAVTEG